MIPYTPVHDRLVLHGAFEPHAPGTEFFEGPERGDDDPVPGADDPWRTDTGERNRGHLRDRNRRGIRALGRHRGAGPRVAGRQRAPRRRPPTLRDLGVSANAAVGPVVPVAIRAAGGVPPLRGVPGPDGGPRPHTPADAAETFPSVWSTTREAPRS